MKKTCFTTRWTWVFLLMLLSLALAGANQTWAQRANIGPFDLNSGRSRSHQQYDPQTVTTVQGQVESLGSYGMIGWRVAPGMQIQGLVLKTDKGNITINLGAPRYVSQQGFQLKLGDSLEVTGSKVTSDDQTLLLASQVKKDGQTLKVRDDKGAPLWQEQDRGGRGFGGRGRGMMGSGGSGGRGLSN
jgi:hypothetical protein